MTKLSGTHHDGRDFDFSFKNQHIKVIPEPLATFIIENAVHSKSWQSMVGIFKCLHGH